MNKERMLQVALAIEAHAIPDLGFNMNFIYEPVNEVFEHGNIDQFFDRSGFHCKTLACIAGFTSVVGGFIPKTRYSTKEAQMYLGLNDHEAGLLFFNDVDRKDLESSDEKFLNVDSKQAAQMLRTCVEHNKILTWNEFFELQK